MIPFCRNSLCAMDTGEGTQITKYVCVLLTRLLMFSNDLCNQQPIRLLSGSTTVPFVRPYLRIHPIYEGNLSI